MARRVSLPAADELFRATGDAAGSPGSPAKAAVRAVPDAPVEAPEAETDETSAKAGASGRIRHDEKMTVYVTSDELMDVEHARLRLRGTHGLAVDRGRLVREAVALVLADLEENGEESMLVRRLVGE